MGRIFKPKYTVNTPNGGKEVRETRWYYVEYTDGRGRTRRKKAAPIYALAKEILRKCEEEASK